MINVGILGIKEKTYSGCALACLKSRSSLGKISLKTPNSASREKISSNSMRNLGGLNLEVNGMLKSNRNLQEHVLNTMSSVKKLKSASKKFRNREIEFENLHNEFEKSDENLEKLKNKLRTIDVVLIDLYHHCKNSDDEAISLLYLANTKKKSNLTFEELYVKPETTRSGIKTSRKSNLKSPYDSKIFTFPHKKLKKVSKTNLSIKQSQSNKKIDKKFSKIFKRLNDILIKSCQPD